MNVTKIIVVEDATYAVGERKPNDLLYIHSFIPQFKDMTYIHIFIIPSLSFPGIL